MSGYTEGLSHQLMNALEKADFTPVDVDKLRQFKDLRLIKEIVHGRAKIVLIEGVITEILTLGFHKTLQAYRAALEANGDKIGDYANQILEKIPIAVTETQIRLISKTNAELGFPNGATRQESYDRGLELGYFLCPAEVGPASRLACPDQPRGEYFLVAMEPIIDSVGRLCVFSVGHNNRGFPSSGGSTPSTFILAIVLMPALVGCSLSASSPLEPRIPETS
jgi:hypothetical protein